MLSMRHQGDTQWSQWVRPEKEQLSLVMERHGIEREDNDKHLSVLDDEKEQRAQEIAALEMEKQRNRARWGSKSKGERNWPRL